jgi:hypothetical protein
MKEKRIWQPAVFIFIYASWPGNGGAFNSFLAVCPNVTESFPCTPIEDGADLGGGLGFSPSQLFSYMLAIAGVGGTVGTYIYKRSSVSPYVDSMQSSKFSCFFLILLRKGIYSRFLMKVMR